MGYELHIHRGEDWSELSEQEGVSLAEWHGYVEEADDFRMDDAAEASTPDGAVIRIESPGIAVWTGHPEGVVAWFSFDDDQIVVKSPDEAMIVRAREIARALGARVQGDDGEFYDESGPEPPAEEPRGRRDWLGRLRRS